MTHYDDIQLAIPTPVLKKVAVNHFDDAWYQKIWKYLTEKTEYEYVEDWRVCLPNGLRVFIPAGEITDGASIPWFVRAFATSFGPLLRAACIHDFGYRNNYLIDWDGLRFAVNVNRKFHDDLFLNVIIWTTDLSVLANSAWSAVRCCGWIPWYKNRRRGAK